MGLFVPDEAYVEQLAEQADAGLELAKSVWRDSIPIDVRDRAGLFHTARHVAYCAHMTAPDDEEMSLFQTLVAGLDDRYGLPGWRARRTHRRIMEWVRMPEHAEFVERQGKIPNWHPRLVYGCACHEVRLAGAAELNGRGFNIVEIANRLGCTDRHVHRLLDEWEAPREKRPRWNAREIDVLLSAVKETGTGSERQACFDVAKTLGRKGESVYRHWKRMKRNEVVDGVRKRSAGGVE